MKVVDALHRFGGVASRSALIEATSRRAVDRALRRGHVVRDGHGRYALPTADAALRAANGLAAVLSLRSAAMYWGWEQKHPPTEPDLTVPHNRKVPAEKQRGAKVHWMDFQDGDVVLGIVTSRRRTLVDCLRRLPFDEALAIADSALRHGESTRRAWWPLPTS